MLGIKSILHPTDFSLRSNVAFWFAASLARDYNARLVLLHVAEPVLSGYGEGMMVPAMPADVQPLREKLEQLQLWDPKIQVERRVVEGDAAAEIIGTAELLRCDVIVMGTHGRTGLSRLLMGSVAEHVVRHAHCPVVTIKSSPDSVIPSELPLKAVEPKHFKDASCA